MEMRLSGAAVDMARPRLGHALGLLAFVQFLVVLNTSIVNVALGPIGAQWSMSPSALSRVVNAYLLPFGGLSSATSTATPPACWSWTPATSPAHPWRPSTCPAESPPASTAPGSPTIGWPDPASSLPSKE